MARTATVRDLRNRFPLVKKMVEEEGEVLVTDKGMPRYKLTRYTRKPDAPPPPKDYMARLRRHQPRPLSRTVARALDELDRGDC